MLIGEFWVIPPNLSCTILSNNIPCQTILFLLYIHVHTCIPVCALLLVVHFILVTFSVMFCLQFYMAAMAGVIYVAFVNKELIPFVAVELYPLHYITVD